MNPSSSFDKTSAQSELEWRAWCYLNGELSAQETQAFEAQLHDPAVCRLLAELIDLQATLQTTPAAPAPVLVSHPQPVSTAAQGHRWSGIIVLLTTTAALWLVFFGSWTSDSDNTLAQHRTESQQLTALWLTPEADNPDADNMAAIGDDFLHDAALDGDWDNVADNNTPGNETLGNDTEVPGWLIAAVTPPDPDTDSIE